jgi:type IV secretion system protein VirB6
MQWVLGQDPDFSLSPRALLLWVRIESWPLPKIIPALKNIIFSIVFIAIFSCNILCYGSNYADNDMSDLQLSNLKSTMKEIDPKKNNRGFVTSNISIDASKREVISTNIKLEQGKLLRIQSSFKDIRIEPDKYKILFRIDPRFERPQLFIQKYDYQKKAYILDLNNYNQGAIKQYVQNHNGSLIDLHRDLVRYFNFASRDRIKVPANSIIAINIDDSMGYFSDSDPHEGLAEIQGGEFELTTVNSIQDNRIVYTSAKNFCQDIVALAAPESYSEYCVIESADSAFYRDLAKNFDSFTGHISQNSFLPYLDNLDACPAKGKGLDQDSVCFYHQGRGLEIRLGNRVIKSTDENFVRSPFSGHDIFVFKSQAESYLDFNTSWAIAGMYDVANVSFIDSLIWKLDRFLMGDMQFMKNWPEETFFEAVSSARGTVKWVFNSFLYKIQSFKLALQKYFRMRFLHFGRYFLYVEIGPDISTINSDIFQYVKMQYAISKNSDCSDIKGSFTDIQSHLLESDADADGYLCLRVENAGYNITGNINLALTNYTGSKWFSSLVYDKTIMRIRHMLDKTMLTIYNGLATDGVLKLTAQILLTLYIVIYGSLFSLGLAQVNSKELLIRTAKICIISLMFSPQSWNFFNTYLFGMFLSGIDGLMFKVMNLTSSANNPFGFVDPILNHYLDPSFWISLLAQLFSISSGLWFFAIMMIIMIIKYLGALLEVIITYCLAMIGMSVMISLAPLFFLFMLFERTRSIFSNWLSLLFSYVLKPSLLLVFFLLIEQILKTQIAQVTTPAVWDKILDIGLSIKLPWSGGSSYFVKLPFLPDVSFYTPVIEAHGALMKIITSSIIFLLLMKIGASLPAFVDSIIGQLTQVRINSEPLVQSEQQQKDNKTGSRSAEEETIKGAKKNIQRPLAAVGKFAKNKVLGQKIDKKTLARELGEK